MAYTLTPWGYEIDGTLQPLLTVADFNTLTDSAWAGDARAESAIKAASAALRNFCGWHVAPSAACRAVLDTEGARSLFLPTRNLTGVTSVTVHGTAVTGYEWSAIGQVDLPTRAAPGLRAITVEYAAGLAFTDDLMALTALVAGMAARTLALSPKSYGVVSESAGGVSITRAQGAAYSLVAVTLTDGERDALMPYKVVRAHAT